MNKNFRYIRLHKYVCIIDYLCPTLQFKNFTYNCSSHKMKDEYPLRTMLRFNYKLHALQASEVTLTSAFLLVTIE